MKDDKMEENLRELGHTQLVRMVKRSLGPKSQVTDPQSQIPNPKFLMSKK